MEAQGPMFLFLAAMMVSIFSFVSIAVWVTTQAAERKARDRMAILRAAIEHPGENAMRVIEFLREEDERQAERKERETRQGFIIGGLTTLAAGVGLIALLLTSGGKGWGVGLIPGLVGVALLSAGLFKSRLADSPDRK